MSRKHELVVTVTFTSDLYEAEALAAVKEIMGQAKGKFWTELPHRLQATKVRGMNRSLSKRQPNKGVSKVLTEETIRKRATAAVEALVDGSTTRDRLLALEAAKVAMDAALGDEE